MNTLRPVERESESRDEISVQIPPMSPVIAENVAGFTLLGNLWTVRYKLPNWDAGGTVFAKVCNGGWLQA
jgi:hypothetical protein